MLSKVNVKRRLSSDRSRERGFIYLLSFLIPMAVMLIVYVAMGFYPFGEKSLLTADMYGQYVCFISYFKDMFANGNDLFYTFSKSLGGDMYGFSAYYLFSPFNLLALLFPTRDLPQAIMLITLLKTGAAGLSFDIFASKETGFKKGVVLFSAGYALMAFMFVYQQNILWLDAVVGLPIVMLGIHRLVSEKKPALYIFSLGLCLVINYYTGYILCLFSVLYFIFKIVTTTSFLIKEERSECLKSAVRFAVSSLLAAGLAAIVLLPAVFSLRGGAKNSFTLSDLNFESHFRLLDMFSKTYSNSFENNDLWHSDLPSIFSGVLTVGSTIMFFMNRNIRIRERLAGAALLAIMAISCQLDGFYLIWHAFNAPVGFPCRQAFVISFVMLYLGYRCYFNKNGITLKNIGMTLGIYALITVIVEYTEKSYLDAASLWSDVVIMSLFAGIAAAVILFPKMSPMAKSLLLLGAVFIQSCNLAFNGLDTLGKIDYYSQEDFSSYIDRVQPVIDWVKSEDGGFYRLEKTFQRDHNDPMLLSYRGLSHFSSTEKTATKEFLERFGFRNDYYWVYYNHGSTIAADGFLGVKYVLAETPPNEYYRELYSENGITVYINPYALPLGFMTDDGDVTEADLTGKNPFAFQNALYFEMTGENDLFVPVENVSMSLNGLTDRGNGSYLKTGDGEAVFTFTNTREEPLYVYLPADYLSAAEIDVNGRGLGEYFTARRYDVVNLGQYELGENITFTVRAENAELYFSDAYFYYQDMEKTAAVTDMLNSHRYEIDKFSSSHFKGTVTVTEGQERMITTIPADEGWTVKVDGKKTEPVKAFDALWSVRLSPGTHTVEWRYVPKGFAVGAVVSVISLIAVLAWILRRKVPNSHSPAIGAERSTDAVLVKQEIRS